MNILFKFLLAFTILGITSASYWLEDDSEDDYQPAYREDKPDSLSVFKRQVTRVASSGNWCIPWRSPCTLNDVLLAKYKFLRCCNNGACTCNLWGSNCRCEARLGR